MSKEANKATSTAPNVHYIATANVHVFHQPIGVRWQVPNFVVL